MPLRTNSSAQFSPYLLVGGQPCPTHTHTRDRAYESQRPPTSKTSPASDLLWNVTTLRHTKQVHQSSSPDRFHTGAFFGARPVRIPGTPGRKVKKQSKEQQKDPWDSKADTHSDIGFQLTQLPRWEGR